MKTNKTLLKELREQLHHWQMIARMEARGLRATRTKCKVIGEQMRKLQNGKNYGR